MAVPPVGNIRVLLDCLSLWNARSNLCPPGRLRAKRRRCPTGGICVEPVHEPGRGLGPTLLVAPALSRGGDVEPIQVPTCKRAGGALSGRDNQFLAQYTLRGIAMDPSAAVDRHPDVAVRVDG